MAKDWMRTKNLVGKLEQLLKANALKELEPPLSLRQVSAAKLMLRKLRPAFKPIEAPTNVGYVPVTHITRVIVDEVGDGDAPDRPSVTVEQRDAEAADRADKSRDHENDRLGRHADDY